MQAREWSDQYLPVGLGYTQVKHRDVCDAELEDRMRSTQRLGGFRRVSAQAMAILSRVAEDITEQHVYLLSHPWRKR